MSTANSGWTQGTSLYMTVNGDIVSFVENTYRETPSTVIQDLYNMLTSSTQMTEFYDILDSCGYDMMCTIHGRLKTLLAADDILTEEERIFWSEEWQRRLFTDLFHISTHVCPLCHSETGMFHPGLAKFSVIFAGKPNHQVVEHMWKKFNKLQYMKGMCKEKFRMMLFIFQDHTNKQNRAQRLKNGYHFESVSKIRKLRNYVEDVSNKNMRLSLCKVLHPSCLEEHAIQLM